MVGGHGKTKQRVVTYTRNEYTMAAAFTSVSYLFVAFLVFVIFLFVKSI